MQNQPRKYPTLEPTDQHMIGTIKTPIHNQSFVFSPDISVIQQKAQQQQQQQQQQQFSFFNVPENNDTKNCQAKMLSSQQKQQICSGCFELKRFTLLLKSVCVKSCVIAMSALAKCVKICVEELCVRQKLR